MYNKIQQRFDKSIREAVETTKRARETKPRRPVALLPVEQEKPLRGRLYLCPETGATVWEPEIAPMERSSNG